MENKTIITLFGGPKHNKKYHLENPRIGFLIAEGGHYARVQGGVPNEWYWRNFPPPIAVGGDIVERVKHGE